MTFFPVRGSCSCCWLKGSRQPASVGNLTDLPCWHMEPKASSGGAKSYFHVLFFFNPCVCIYEFHLTISISNFYYQQNAVQSFTAKPQRKHLRERFKARKLAVKCAQWELFKNGVALFSISLQPYSTDVFLLCRGRAEHSRRSTVSSPAESLQSCVCRHSVSSWDNTATLHDLFFFWFFFILFQK